MFHFWPNSGISTRISVHSLIKPWEHVLGKKIRTNKFYSKIEEEIWRKHFQTQTSFLLLRERRRYNPRVYKGAISMRTFLIMVDINIWLIEGELQDPLWLPWEAPWSQLPILGFKVRLHFTRRSLLPNSFPFPIPITGLISIHRGSKHMSPINGSILSFIFNTTFIMKAFFVNNLRST